ncbi:WD40 repeat - like 10, partial [Theobroma cacao]
MKATQRWIYLADVTIWLLLVDKINLYGELNGHEECVNTVEFNSTGDLLVSGSDDKHVVLWNWATKSKTLSYASGHLDNIFHARIIPFADEKKIVTSPADGQVRLGEILENGQVRTRKLGEHQGRVHNLAVDPGSPHIFYSSGEDGLVQHIMEFNRQRQADQPR